MKFYDRINELDRISNLKEITKKKGSRVLVITGRRRINQKGDRLIFSYNSLEKFHGYGNLGSGKKMIPGVSLKSKSELFY